MWIFKNYKLLTKKEHMELLNIRNSNYVREVSKDKNIILLDNHLKWIKNIDNSKCYLALFVDNKIIGGLNYSYKNNIVENWGIFFDEQTQPLISSIATYLFIEFMFSRFDVLYSEVLKENQRALKFNQYFGIKIIETTKELYKLQLTKEEWNKNKTKLKILEKRINKIKYKFEC